MLGYDQTDYDWTDGESKIQTWEDLMHPDDQEQGIKKFADYLKNDKLDRYENTFRLRMKNGKFAWIWSRGKTLLNQADESTKLTLGTHIDITEMKELERDLFLQKEHFHKILLSVSDGVIATDQQGQVMMMNKTAEELTGMANKKWEGRFIDQVFSIYDPSGKKPITFGPANAVFETKGTQAALKPIGEQERIIEFSVAPITNADKHALGIVTVFRDISKQKEEQQEIEYLSYHDQLTGLYNRRYFVEALERLSQERRLPLSIVMIDANGLKLMNDVFGHHAGDQLLQKVAKHLIAQTRKYDLACRVGGDEFVVLLPNTTSTDAKAFIDRVEKKVNQDSLESLPLSLSYGWSVKETSSDDIERVYQRAEEQMYHQKTSQRAEIRTMMIDQIVNQLHQRLPNERIHAAEVERLAVLLGIELGLKNEQINQLAKVAWFHDIGKIVIPPQLLTKAEKLTDQEIQQLRRHAEAGYRILSTANIYAVLADPILAHHERWDGLGYPKGMKGEEIPLFSRIIAVVEAYDQMTNQQSYRDPLEASAAKTILKREAGKQFDPKIVECFVTRVI